MEKGILITLPKYDDATEYLTHYSKSIIKKAKAGNIKIKEVRDKKNLNIENFSNIVNKLDYKMIMFNGHGTADSIFGYKNNVIIQVGKNEALFRERIIYARSCNAGLILAIKCTKNTKEGCFIGYKFPFVFFMDEKWSAKPHNDNVAKLFLLPSNSIPISLIKGNSAFEANNTSKNQILKNIKKLLRDSSEPETDFLIEGLWNNYIGQVIEGNKNARLN